MRVRVGVGASLNDQKDVWFRPTGWAGWQAAFVRYGTARVGNMQFTSCPPWQLVTCEATRRLGVGATLHGSRFVHAPNCMITKLLPFWHISQSIPIIRYLSTLPSPLLLRLPLASLIRFQTYAGVISPPYQLDRQINNSHGSQDQALEVTLSTSQFLCFLKDHLLTS